MINAKMLGMLAAAFVAGSFLASPELRAYAANTVFSTDIVDGQVKTADLAAAAVTAPKLGANSVNSAKVADNSITAADIGANAVAASELATDSVGASELQGVTKLIFTNCDNGQFTLNAGANTFLVCSNTGASLGDSVIATIEDSSNCIAVSGYRIVEEFGVVSLLVGLENTCTYGLLGTPVASIIIFDK